MIFSFFDSWLLDDAHLAEIVNNCQWIIIVIMSIWKSKMPKKPLDNWNLADFKTFYSFKVANKFLDDFLSYYPSV